MSSSLTSNGTNHQADVHTLADIVNEVSKSRCAPVTRNDYVARCRKMAEWLFEQKYFTAARYNRQLGAHELIVEGITVDMIKQYLFPLVRDGKSFSTISSIRSALSFEYAEKRVQMPEEVFNQFSHAFKGRKRVLEEVKAGSRIRKGNKVAMGFHFYKAVQKIFVIENTAKVALYSTLTWNLMCGSNNIAELHLDRMGWENDSLTVWFDVKKSDVFEDRPVAPRHVFANPYVPEVCPILSLGVYLLVNPELTGKLFPGVNPRHPLKQAFISMRNKESNAQLFARYGVSPEDCDVSSYQHGASAHVADASTAGPSYTALCNRMGLKIKNALDVRLFYDKAQDQYIGRMISGLPAHSENFAILPPHFDVEAMENDGISLVDVIKTCFTRLNQSKPHLTAVLKKCIASVVYHSQWLRDHLPSNHELFATPLFTARDWLRKLKRHVILSHTSPYVTGTGIPPHVSLCMKAVRSKKQDEKLLSNIEQLLNVHAGVATGGLQLGRSDFLSIVKEAMEPLSEQLTVLQRNDYQFDDVSSSATQRGVSTTHRLARQGECRVVPLLHQHVYPDGNAYMVPPGYQLPPCNIVLGWRLWWCGDDHRKISPFRSLEGGCPPKSSYLQKRLNDWKQVYGKMEQYLRLTNQIRGGNRPSELDISKMYKIVSEQILMGMCYDKSKKRLNELSVLTFTRRFTKFDVVAAAQAWNLNRTVTSTNQTSSPDETNSAPSQVQVPPRTSGETTNPGL